MSERERDSGGSKEDHENTQQSKTKVKKQEGDFSGVASLMPRDEDWMEDRSLKNTAMLRPIERCSWICNARGKSARLARRQRRS